MEKIYKICNNRSYDIIDGAFYRGDCNCYKPAGESGDFVVCEKQPYIVVVDSVENCDNFTSIVLPSEYAGCLAGRGYLDGGNIMPGIMADGVYINVPCIDSGQVCGPPIPDELNNNPDTNCHNVSPHPNTTFSGMVSTPDGAIYEIFLKNVSVCCNSKYLYIVGGEIKIKDYNYYSGQIVRIERG